MHQKNRPACLASFKKTAWISGTFFCLLVAPAAHSENAIEQKNIQLAASSYFGDDELEPRLKSKKREEERKERERKRKALSSQKEKESLRRKKDDSWKPVHKQEKAKEDKEFEAKKEYMSYWQRFQYQWSRANSLQDLFDQSLSKGYAPAQVKESYLNLKSGPGRNYPVIYIAEQEEWVDFASIRTDWYEIITKDGHKGWANQKNLPATLSSADSNISFGDAAKKIQNRAKPIDIGFSAGFLNENALTTLTIRNHNSPFFSSEASMGISAGENAQNRFFKIGILSHPFTEWKNAPHFSMGLGRMNSDFTDANGTIQNEGNIFVSAGLGITKNLDNRFQLRADLNQLAVDTESTEINTYTQLSAGAAFVWGSATDKVFNRSIGKKVGISDFELTLFTGTISLDDIGAYSLAGLRTTYHASEDYFFELSLTDTSTEYSYYSFSGGYNILPGEVVIPWRDHKNFWPTQIFVLGGAGVNSADDETDASMLAGFGIRLSPLRRFSIRFDVRENIVRQRVNGDYAIAKNPETSFGLSYYF